MRDELVLVQELSDGAAELAGSVPVNQPDARHLGHERLVEKLLRARERLVHAAPDHVQLGDGPLARLELDVDADFAPAAPARRSRAPGPAARPHERGVACPGRRFRPRGRAAPARCPRVRAHRPRRGRRWPAPPGARAVPARRSPTPVPGRVARSRWPMASTAARASARAAPVSPVGMTVAARHVVPPRRPSHPSGPSVRRPRRRSHGAHHAVDRRFARRAGAGTSLRGCAAPARAPAAWSLRLRAAAPFARGQPPLVFERLDVPLDLRQVLGELGLASAAVRPGAVDDRVGQAEPRRDFEREAAARRTVVQPVGRRERRRDRSQTRPA